MTTAEKISEAVADIRLNEQQKKKGGTVVHYAFGAMMGQFTVPPRTLLLR